MNHTSERLMSRRVILFLILGMVFVFSLSGAAAVRADFTNAPGSSLTYSRTEDGGVSVTMKAADNWNISPDRLIWDKTFSTDDTVEVYVAPDCFNNGALHYLVIRLADKGSDTYVYELHVGNQGTGNFNLRSSVNIWTDFAASQTGIAHLTFRIGENGLETIYEGNVIETISSFTAENFPNGIEISFRAYAEAMWGGSGADLTSYIRVDNPKAIDAEKVFFLTQDEDLSYAIDLNGATATAVTLNRNGETAVVLDPDDYVLTDVLLTLTATGLKKAISDAGDYTITIENPAKNISLHMRVSGVESLQPESTKHVYDRYSGGDLSFTVWNNKDTYLRLLDENNVEVVGVNYNSINNMLIIPESYLQGLTSGTHNFRIVSEMLPDGVAFSVAISNSAPPLYEGVALNFDRYQPQDLVFSVSLFENDSIWLEGNGIESSDFSAIGETVTIFSSFFAGVEPGVLTIYLCGENGKTSLEIAITDSEPAVLISDDTAQINLLSISDAEFGFEMKYDEILSVTGNGITEGDWTVNDKDDLIILRTFISSALATEGSYSFDVLSKNGGEFCLTIVTDKMSPPTIEGENRATFSKNASAEVSFQVALNDSEFLGISGGGITGGNYTTDIHEGILKLTFSENFLLGLTNGRHTFSLRFTNGEILVEIAVENTFIPEFENGEVFLFAESNGDDLTVGLEARYGVLLTAEGLGENDFVYDSVKSTLTILADFLREVDESTELKFVFDNGNATLIVEIPYQTDILETYEPAWVSGAPDGSVRLSGREDGWVNVEYLTPTAGAYGGGIKIRTPFRAERPVEIYVDFGSVPDLAGTSFALTLSSDAHKMHYGIDPCDLFGSFGVGDDFLQSGYFGKPGVHDALDQQISHELMRRSESGYETFTFDIGESGTKIYLNGRLIREVADVTRSVFANGDVYVLFTPLFWHDQEGTDFMIKSNAPVQVEETSYRLNKKTMAPVVIHANIRGLFEGIALFDGEEEIEISTFRYERDILNGNTEISIPAESILYRRGFSADKEYWLRVKTSTGNIDAPLVLFRCRTS